MKNLIYILFIFLSFTSQAQTIKGVVFSGQDKTPVEFAPVALLHMPDSAIVNSLTTKAGGIFAFENVKPGSYFIKATCLSCKANGKRVEVTGDSKTIQLDTIFMALSSKQLAEVNVIGQRILAKELVDRTVYTIPASIAATSINGYEILRKIPGIQVDFQNNVTLNGKSNFIIQIDGKQRDKEYLARLQPSDIQSIEVISNPSSKYEGSIDGVINIILKKEARYGINGNVGAYVRPAKKSSGYVAGSLEYGLGRVSIYATVYTFFQGLDNKSTNYSRFLYNDSVTDLNGKGSFGISSTSINTGFDYYINDKNNLSFNFSFKPTNMNNSANNEGPVNVNGAEKYFFRSPTHSGTLSEEYNASLFYKKQYAKPIKELTAEASFYHFYSKDNNSFGSTLFQPDSITVIDALSRYQEEKNVNNRNYMSAKVDFVQPIGFSSKFEAGYQLYYQQIKYNSLSSEVILNNVYDYSELRNAAYAGLTFNVKKLSMQGMLRAEYSNIYIDKDTTSDYITLLPSVNIQYKFSTSHNVKFTYNRRINRPSIYDLNPFQKLNGYSISEGNPRLKPEYRDKLQLTYTFNLGGSNIAPNIYYEAITHKVGQRISLVESSLTNSITTLSTPDNILTGYERGFGLNAMITAFKKVTFSVNGRLYQGHYNGLASQGIPVHDYSSYSVTSYAFAPVGWKVNAFLFFSYNGVSIDAYTKTYSPAIYGLGAQKTAGNHTIGLFYLLPFSNNIMFNKTITETPITEAKSTTSFNVSYYIQVMYSYKFNKGKAVKKVSRKTEVESDTKGGGLKTQ
jgi:hypothetical protein